MSVNMIKEIESYKLKMRRAPYNGGTYDETADAKLACWWSGGHVFAVGKDGAEYGCMQVSSSRQESNRYYPALVLINDDGETVGYVDPYEHGVPAPQI